MCYFQENGKQVTLRNNNLKITWTQFRGEYIARAGGGIWFKDDDKWFKVAELAQASVIITDPVGKEYLSNPISFRVNGDRTKISLFHAPLVVEGIEWKIREHWELEHGDNKLHWCYEFVPSCEVDGPYLLSTAFSVLPNIWRAIVLPSYCGFYDDICYAIYPRRDDTWWMRLEGARISQLPTTQLIWDTGIRNVHYPFTYKPTKLSDQANRVVLEGYFLVDRWTPQQLAIELRNYFQPRPHPIERALHEVRKLAFEALVRAFENAKETGLFAEDEGAFTDMVSSDGWMHQHNDATFGAGFSCGFSGQAIVPLLTYYEQTGESKAKEMAEQIANWLVRYVQTEYGAYYDLYDMNLKAGFDFIGEDFVYPHTTARIAINIFRAYEFFGKEEYKISALKACDWMLSLQEANGGLPWKIVGSLNESDGSNAYAAPVAMAISAWIEAYKLTSDEKYLRASKRLANWVNGFIESNQFGGYITDDRPMNGFNRWETPSSPSISYVINGLINLYKLTGDNLYLEKAERAGYFSLLWQWIWEFPAGCLEKKVKGTTQAAGAWCYTIEQTLGNELPNVIEGYLDLYEATEKEIWLNAAELAIACLVEQQFKDPSDLKCGTIFEGWNINHNHEVPLKTPNFSRGLLGGTSALLHVLQEFSRLAKA